MGVFAHGSNRKCILGSRKKSLDYPPLIHEFKGFFNFFHETVVYSWTFYVVF
jgi:hypothetical protein